MYFDSTQVVSLTRHERASGKSLACACLIVCGTAEHVRGELAHSCLLRRLAPDTPAVGQQPVVSVSKETY